MPSSLTIEKWEYEAVDTSLGKPQSGHTCEYKIRLPSDSVIENNEYLFLLFPLMLTSYPWSWTLSSNNAPKHFSLFMLFKPLFSFLIVCL